MATVVTVPEWAGGKLANGEFHDYSTEIVRIAGALDAEKIPVSAAVAELRTTNATLAPEATLAASRLRSPPSIFCRRFAA